MSLTIIILLCVAAFVAGFIDAIAGGGGLIQTPAALVLLPQLPVVNVISTAKIPAFSGTLFAAVQYVRKVKLDLFVTIPLILLAFAGSLLGSYILTLMTSNFMKPVLLVVLTCVAVYTFIKKDFGQKERSEPVARRNTVYAMALTLVIGFYDGFIGPGTGSFLLLAFITILGQDFLHASAQAKLVNLATNLASIIVFSMKGKILWTIAIPMAISNSLGGTLGARVAIAKGNRFIRILFLVIVTLTLLRLATGLAGL